MSNADASRAMQALDGKDFEGRALKVNEAKARESGGGGGGRDLVAAADVVTDPVLS